MQYTGIQLFWSDIEDFEHFYRYQYLINNNMKKCNLPIRSRLIQTCVEISINLQISSNVHF